jgi:predicted NUDIX family NTP pyrophosphohydrolase
MSELGEYYQEQRAANQKEKEKRRKWNTDVVDGLSAEYGFNVVKHTEHHFSLYHPTRGRMDYWPSTGKHGWFNKNKVYGKIIVIQDIEAYLIANFKPIG